MTSYLRQSTAIDIAIGPFLDVADGATAETSLTISQADIRLKKGNGAWAQKNDTNAATHEENGWYEASLNTTDTNTVGRLVVAINEAGALPVWHEFYILEEVVFDALVAASSAGYASQESVDTISGYLDTEVAATLAAVDTEVAAIKAKTDNLPTDPSDASDIAASFASLASTLSTLSGYIDTEVAAIKAKTDNLPASPAAVGSVMQLDLTQSLDLTPTTETIGDALLAARVQGFGKWVASGTTLSLYAADETTVLIAFTLDSASSPTSRTPV